MNCIGPIHLSSRAVERLALVIPVYEPTAELKILIKNLFLQSQPESNPSFDLVVIVNDGSGPEYQEIFQSIQMDFPSNKIRILHHAVNLGKGAALKTAFNFLLVEEPNLKGVLTADADGQHRVEDILSLAREFASSSGHDLIIGSRSIAKSAREDVPMRSRLGNLLTRWVFALLVGPRIFDTQSGLRAVPKVLLPTLLELRSDRYEFELEMLVVARRVGVGVREIPAHQIYFDKNQGSHFNPLMDSLRIYFVLLRFVFSSAVTQLLDTIFFSLVFWSGLSLLPSQAVGRVGGVSVNFILNRRFVFKSKQKIHLELIRFLLLVIGMMFVSYALIQFFHQVWDLPVIASKFAAEGLLFVASFSIQRLFVFRNIQLSKLGVKP